MLTPRDNDPIIELHDDVDGVSDPLVPPAYPWKANGWRLAMVPVDESGASAGAAVGRQRTEAEGLGSTPGWGPNGTRDGRASSVEGEDRETRSSPGDVVATGGGLETAAAPLSDRAAIEAEARRAGVVLDTLSGVWADPGGEIRAWPWVEGGWRSGPTPDGTIDEGLWGHHPTELDALRALPSCEAWIAEQSAQAHAETLAALATTDREQIAALGQCGATLSTTLGRVLTCALPPDHGKVHRSEGGEAWAGPPTGTTREVPAPRMIDALTPRQRTAALEMLMRDHDPRVALRVAAVVAEVRHG